MEYRKCGCCLTIHVSNNATHVCGGRVRNEENPLAVIKVVRKKELTKILLKPI